MGPGSKYPTQQPQRTGDSQAEVVAEPRGATPPLVVPSGPVSPLSPISPLPLNLPCIVIPPRELAARSAAYSGGGAGGGGGGGSGSGAFAQQRALVRGMSEGNPSLHSSSSTGLPHTLPPSLVHWPYASHMPAVSPGFTHLPKSRSDGDGAPPTASPATEDARQGRMRNENWGEVGSPWRGGGGAGGGAGGPSGAFHGVAGSSHGKVTRVPSGDGNPIPVSSVPWQRPKSSPLQRSLSAGSPCAEDAAGGGGGGGGTTIWEQWQALGRWGRKAEESHGSGSVGYATWAPPPLPAAAAAAAAAGAADAAGGVGAGSGGKGRAMHSESIAHKTGVLNEREARAPKPTWSVSLLAAPCHVHPCLCMEACFCPCVSVGRLAHALDPVSSSTPAAGALLYSLLSCFLSCHVYTSLLRGRVRERYSLPQAPLGRVGDCCAHCCCNPCALMQEIAEAGLHGDMPVDGAAPGPTHQAGKVAPAPVGATWGGGGGGGGGGGASKGGSKVKAAMRAPAVVTM
ncbi:hypothetical protein CLOM_g4850 [Closterium sp. NIES-68]|nr:hypothetical protein CLOM_g4850 [Closterium sp. NIES-68]GJP80680.1 hypothetical protein CLOP_g10882 [Closterium sp. NIES-67]